MGDRPVPVTPLRRPPKGKTWWHVDRLGKRNGRVWAVQFWEDGKPVYLTARAVLTSGLDAYSQTWPEGQPRAVIEFSGAVAKRLPNAVVVLRKADG